MPASAREAARPKPHLRATCLASCTSAAVLVSPPQSHSPPRLPAPASRPAPLRSSHTLSYTPSSTSSRTLRPRTSPGVTGRRANRSPAGRRRARRWAGWDQTAGSRRRREGWRVAVTSHRKARLRGKSGPDEWSRRYGAETVSSGVPAGLYHTTSLPFLWPSSPNDFPVQVIKCKLLSIVSVY